MHGGRKRVVGAGAHVDVIVGVDWFLRAHCSTQNLYGAIRDDFVGVHVGLSTRAGLPNYEWEVVEEGEIRNLRGSLLYSFAKRRILRPNAFPLSLLFACGGMVVVVTEPEFHVHFCCSTFENSECTDNGRRHAVMRLIDFEVLEGAFGLRSPIFVRGNGDLAKGIAFCSCSLALISA